MPANTMADQLRALIADAYADPKRKLTDGKLGTAADVPKTTLWRFRKGERDITLATASSIAGALGVLPLAVGKRRAR